MIDGAEIPFELEFAFNEKDELPGRVVSVIGRNAVGKTRLLANLGVDLTQIARSSANALSEKNDRFKGARPLFNRVIAISYSAFDRFRRPQPGTTTSYIYCGIRNDRGVLSRESLIETDRNNQRRIRQHGRQSEWTRHMQTILGDQSISLLGELNEEIGSETDDLGSLALLSSGQAILSHFVTALLAWVEPKTLVLFDEPETHLHPSAVASLFLVLTAVLDHHDSYAILATHSPVVIQEVPGKRVLLLRREGNVTTAEPLGMESFGESVTELTRHVFETVEVESLYRKTLNELASEGPLAEVLGLFDYELGLHAKAYLLAQYAKAKK
jgi:predicted ATPase